MQTLVVRSATPSLTTALPRAGAITRSERNELLLSLLDHIRPMLRVFARDLWYLEADDLEQQAAETILSLLDTHELRAITKGLSKN